MRKLVMLVCITVATATVLVPSDFHLQAGVIPSWEDSSGRFGFWPISNELSIYQNFDDTRADRGRTLQIVAINSLRIFTSFNFEFTADYNYGMTPGLKRDHYIELSLVKPVTSLVSFNVQRVISTFEPESINQIGVRFVF
jgi:hypothetical protein